ncbi:MAG: potassium transporter TrkG [Marinoscillum sp.]
MRFTDKRIPANIGEWPKSLVQLPFWFSLMTLLLIIFDLGFDQSVHLENRLIWAYNSLLILGIVSMIGRYPSAKTRPLVRVRPFDFLLVAFLLLVFTGQVIHTLPNDLGEKAWYFIAIALVFVRELSALKLDFTRRHFDPARLFVMSFILIILVGTALLMVPKATHGGITMIDALFTSTSAVCVTGLVVVDTGHHFTVFGQWVIIVLIQVGGLGIMTFTSYFSYFFRGGSSYETQLLLKDMTSSEKIADVFSTLKKIILVTFVIELIGALFIYFSLDRTQIPTFSERAFFAIFHTVSGFCNAGFSTLTNSLYETGFRFNYPLHLTIAFLFILGGIGFPIIFNVFKYTRYLLFNRLLFFVKRDQQAIHIPWVININTRIVILTTTVLIIVGTVFFYWFEFNNTLAEHQGLGKVVTAFFGAVTPRTAGFNTVDTSALHFSTVMFVFLLMWIGASPGSTGGGIKTSTFAIGTLNYFSLARGKDRLEVFRREIADTSVRRAFAIISLSLAVIGAAVFLIASFDREKDLLSIAFECFSAYSTVGLSLGITAQLSDPSKLVIIATMFIGRVSMLTILIALLRKVRHLKYRYPTEEILIN